MSGAHPGSHVAVERLAGLYSHHAIYVGNPRGRLRGRGNEVIDFCDGHNNEDTNSIVIRCHIVTVSLPMTVRH